MPNGSQPSRGEEPSAFGLLVEGLIDRLQRAPLMRRAPAQCSPEEQRAQASLLAELLALRTLRGALNDQLALGLDTVHTHWPEMSALLSTGRRTGSKPKPRDPQPTDTTPVDVAEGTPVEEDLETPAGSEQSVPVVEQQPVPALAPLPSPAGQPDLAHLLLEALTVQGKPLNTTQLLAWLGERGVPAAREDVTSALFRHEELFRRRGAGQWMVAGEQAQ